MDAYQELINRLDDLGVIVHIERNEMVDREGFPTGSRHYGVTVSNQSGDSFSVVYSQGPAIKEEPSIFGVLSSLILDYDCGGLSFEDFCSDLGYDEDSREDYKLWEQCKVLREEVGNVLSKDVIDNLYDIIQDY